MSNHQVVNDQALHDQVKHIVLADGSALDVLEVKRYLPGRRLVCRCEWQGETVYAKVFWGRDAEKYMLRDQQGIQALVEANILTPAILYVGQVALQQGQVLLLQDVTGADNLETIWQQLPFKSLQRLQLAKKLVTVVAQHHQAGLQQTDLYLKNFIMREEAIYTLDGDGIKPLPKFAEGQAALRNLSALLSKFDVLEMIKWLPQLLKSYGDARGWQTLPRVALLQHLINVHRAKVTSGYADEKVFRTCTDVQVTRMPTQYLAVASGYRDVEGLGQEEVLDQHLQTPAFKKGNTCTVGLLTTKNAQKIVIKRYNIKNAWHGLMRSFRKTRAAVSWSNAHRLCLLGLPTSQPVSLLEQRYFLGLLRGKSYFLSEFIDAPTVDVFFATERDKAKRGEVVKALVELFYRFYLLQISHGDMKASNLMIVDEAPVLIDLDSMQQHRFGLIAKHRHARDLHRFMRNWQHDESLTNAFKKVFKVVYEDQQPLKLANID